MQNIQIEHYRDCDDKKMFEAVRELIRVGMINDSVGSMSGVVSF